jgi:U3 small nucleolar RNA-associated protein 18
MRTTGQSLTASVNWSTCRAHFLACRRISAMASEFGPLFMEDRRRGDDAHPPESTVNLPREADASRKRRRVVSAPRRPAWVDDDDEVGGGNVAQGSDARGDARAPPVPIGAVKRLRKLRSSAHETVVPTSEYAARVRAYYVAEAARRAPGAWAQLPKLGTRGISRKRVSFSDGVGDGDADDESDAGDDDVEGDEEEEEGRGTETEDGLHVGDITKKLLASTGRILSSRAERAHGAEVLTPGTIDIRRVANANREDPNAAVVRCVEFHPSGRLILTAGLDKTLRIFNVDGKSNPKVQGIHLRDLPVHSAHFTNAGDAIVATGRRGYFYRFDLGSGNVAKVQTLQVGRNTEKSLERCVASSDGSRLAILGGRGRVLVVCAKSMRQTGVLRTDATCSAASFSTANEHHLYTAGHGGHVYLWDVRQHACVDRIADEGSVHGTALAASAKHFAVGSDTGVVNVYGRAAMAASRDDEGVTAGRTGKPERAFLNLTTKVSSLAFNCDGRLLAVASESLKNAVRLVHVPTMTVYGNWPTQATNLRRIFCLAFSPGGEYLAIGNDKGSALLFRIRNGYPLVN